MDGFLATCFGIAGFLVFAAVISLCGGDSEAEAGTIVLFGSAQRAVEWLLRPIPAHPAGAAPLNLLETNGGAEWGT